MSTSTRRASKPRRSRLLRGSLGSLVFFLAVLFAVAPRLAAVTSFRNEVFKRFVKNWNGSVEVGAATLGWLTPPEFLDIELRSPTGSTVIEIPRFAADEPLWKFVFTNGDLGTVVISDPRANVVVKREVKKGEPAVPPPADESAPPPPRNKTPVNVDVRIQNLTVLLRSPEMEEHWTKVEKVAINARLSASPDREQLVEVSPGVLLDHVEITPVMGNAGLMFIAPVLSDLAWARGQFSLELETCRINLARPTQGELKGRLSIHAIEAGGKNPIVLEIAHIVRTLVPEAVPRSVRLADNSIVEFEMVDEGIRHRNLAFGLPGVSEDLVIRTEGWVGFDQRLDLVADVPIPLHLLRKQEGNTPVKKEVLRLPIGGTIGKPKIEFKPGDGTGLKLVDRILDAVDPKDPAANQAMETLREVGKALKERSREKPGEAPLGEKILKNGVPKVGRFAQKVLQGTREEKTRKEGKSGPLKGLFKRKNDGNTNDKPDNSSP
ncbi:MAG: hypothetical protein U1D30_05265 [Planctomycetota bacterium]